MGVATPSAPPLPTTTTFFSAKSSSPQAQPQDHNFSTSSSIEKERNSAGNSNNNREYYSMSRDFQQEEGIFAFPNGFDRQRNEQQQRQAAAHQEQQNHQIRRENKLRIQGFDPATSSLVGIDQATHEVYETAGMLSEMFNFVHHDGDGGGVPAANEGLLEHQMSAASFNRNNNPRTGGGGPMVVAGELVGHGLGQHEHQHHHHQPQQQQQHHHHHPISGMNAAAAMQLFLTDRQPRSPTPPPQQPSSTLHMLLPNPSAGAASNSIQGFHSMEPAAASGGGPPHGEAGFSSSGGGVISHQPHQQQAQFSWVPDSTGHDHRQLRESAGTSSHGHELGGNIVEGQGLSLSLASSLQHLEAAKAEELRMGGGSDGGMLFFSHTGGGEGASSSSGGQYSFKGLTGHQQHGGHNHHHHPPQSTILHLEQGGGGHHHGHDPHQHNSIIGYGSVSPSAANHSSVGVVNVLRNSKYAKAAQEILEEFCSVGRGNHHHQLKNKAKFGGNISNPSNSGGGASSSSAKDQVAPPLSTAERMEHQRRKVKLLQMLDEVDRRYNHYCEQMQMVVNSFDLVMGFGAAMPYTALAQKAMSRHFRCLKDATLAQLKLSCELLGEKDVTGSSGLTKGETPRLKLLEQSLRQQRAFQSLGMMEQEAWRPQRGLPERSVNILRAWLFEHFLHPYPSDADKHQLARQTGLSRNQVSNWFINARVRLWKPMVEDMYQQEAREDDELGSRERESFTTAAQTPTPPFHDKAPSVSASAPAATGGGSTAETRTTTTTTTTTTKTGGGGGAAGQAGSRSSNKRSDFNAQESDPSFIITINNNNNNNASHLQHHHQKQQRCSNFPETQAKQLPPPQPPPLSQPMSAMTAAVNSANSVIMGPSGSGMTVGFHHGHDSDMCAPPPHPGFVGTTDSTPDDDIHGSTMIRFGTSTTGDVSLTLGLRHAGNGPEKSAFFR